MKRYSCLLLLLLLSISCSGKEDTKPVPGPEPEPTELKVEWDRINVKTWKGGYARVHRLNDDRLMAVYESGGQAFCRFSSDNGYNWTSATLAIDKEQVAQGAETTWTNNANAEFGQLSANNPHHPGRIIYAVNIRPSGNRSDIFPYSIAYAVSDNNGKTWSERKIAYQSEIWSQAVTKGCWEPFVLELPDGTVQIYFADETPYYRNGRLGYQNISVIESKDGGDSWSDARIVAYTEKKRDGMPVVMMYNNNLYLVVEHYEGSQHFHPQIVWNPVKKNWSKTVTCPDATYRFDPMKTQLDFINNYYGAPYLIATDNYFVLSYQSSEGSGEPKDAHSVMEVVVCPKSEFTNNTFRTMRVPSRPVPVDQSKSCARWNSLCDLGDDSILAVSDVSGTIYLTRGKISGK